MIKHLFLLFCFGYSQKNSTFAPKSALRHCKGNKNDKINKRFNTDDILYKSETIFQTSETNENLTNTGNEDDEFYKNDNFAGNIDLDNEIDSDDETVAEDENYDLLYQNDIIDDKSLEDELQELTPEEQHEIFTNLINSKL